MLAIAGIQIIMQGQGLSPWKGGGFGMYSTYHWKQTEIWYRVNGKVHRLVRISTVAGIHGSPRRESR